MKNLKEALASVEAAGKSELQIGAKIEHEHKGTLEWLKAYLEKHKELPSLEDFAEHIAGDHIGEHPKYYTDMLIPGEQALKSKEKPEEDK